MENNLVGPNVKRLVAYRMATMMIPGGTPDPFMTGASAILAPGTLASAGREALRWAGSALAVIKSAPDNPYGDDNEAIAGALLQQIDARQNIRRSLHDA